MGSEAHDIIRDVGSLATFTALLVALFREPITSWWKKPKLEIRFEPNVPDFTVDPIDLYRAYWLRVFVKNTGRSQVNNVQVVAESVWRIDGAPIRETRFFPMPLRWSFEFIPGTEHPTLMANGIPPGAGQHCDLGNFHKWGEQPKVRLATAIPQGWFEMPPGHHEVRLRISASNAKAIVRILRFTITGEWYSDEAQTFAKAITGVSVSKK